MSAALRERLPDRSDAAPVARRLPWWTALPSAALGGWLLDAASPDLAWWWAAFPAVALVCAAVWQQRARFGALAGLVAGAAFWLPHISWLTLYLGPIPWLGLCGMMLVWFVLFGSAAAYATSALPRVFAHGRAAGRRAWLPVAQALAVAGLWVLREQVQGSWPYGGFPWGRIAHTQADGPLAQAVSWLGFAGFSGLIVLACALVVASVFGRTLLRAGLGGSLALLLILTLLPAAPQQQTGTLRVAAVQGNAKSAIFDDRESGDVLNDHIDATLDLLDDLERRGERVDVIVWPENSAEFEVRSNWRSDMRIRSLAERAGAPIVLGTILRDDAVGEGEDTFTNSSLVWGADGDEGLRYDKRYPVPFAEYMPNRDFFHALVPDLVDLVQLEYTPGQRPAAFDVETADGAVRAGIAICFDIIFDGQAVAMVDDGAQVIFAQTNNADFGRTDESEQQLAIARLRAIETGRAVVNISTVATSAVIDPTGRDLASVAPHTAGSMVAEVPLIEGRTPALRFGAAIAAAWMLLGAAGLLAPLGARVRNRVRRGRPGV